MMNPATLKPIAQEVARAMKNGPFFSFLHLPIQSGSDHVLDLMGRGYTVADVQNIIDIFRAEMPDITIATDIITGFPGETDDDHEETVRLIRRIAPGMVNVTRYSWRPGTGMSRDHELPDRIRKDRSRAIIRESYTMFQKANEKKRGAVMTVIPTEQLKPGSVMARSGRYEGVVIREECQLGIPYMVTITGSTPHYLIGEVVRD
jgi:tRNA A37 methylthiotransferase MiaB